MEWQAAYSDNTGIAALLLTRGADVDATKRDGNTALHLAASKGVRVRARVRVRSYVCILVLVLIVVAILV